MEIGIVGLPGSGKTTIFNALTGSEAEVSAYSGGKKDPNIAQVKVPDERLDKLSQMYNPKKTSPAIIQYVDLGGGLSAKDEKDSMDAILRLLRPCDALVHVVRCFDFAGQPPNPQEDFENFEAELLLTDQMIVERRLERMEKELKKGKKGNPKEFELLKKAYELLDSGRALREDEEISNAPELKGYTFLSAKPCIVVLNLGEDADPSQFDVDLPEGVSVVKIKGSLEMELSQLDEEEAEMFRQDMGIQEPATYMLIRESYSLLGLISFFTVGEDEVKAWTIKKGTVAQKAAGRIHSDIERGFIRAEVVAFDDLIAAGSYQAAQKAGKVRLEGKDYVVQDGDVINFRFNV
ncbi:MAG: redox-regulated ATPase YchF [Thermodesulfobacteria bacterium]|nr:redox-regulated ATPase YchF [Thermodesulfobacteriota bacterium]